MAKYDPDEFFKAERNGPPLLWRDDLITSSEFMTHSGPNGYEIHFRTPDHEKYRTVEDVCRKMIDQAKPPVTNADRIRAMSDEELAEYFTEKFIMSLPKEAQNDESIRKQCYAASLDWLKSKAEAET